MRKDRATLTGDGDMNRFANCFCPVERHSQTASEMSGSLESNNSKHIERMKKALVSAMQNELTQRQRDAISLRYFDGMKLDEIAARLSCSKSSVSRRLKRGRERIHKFLKYGFGENYIDIKQ